MQGRIVTTVAAVAVAAMALLLTSPAMAQDAAAGVPNATQRANINAALDQLRADIAEANRINAGVRSQEQRAKNAEEIAVFQRVLDNLTGKLANGELHPIDNLSRGRDPAAGTLVRFVYEDDNAGVQNAEFKATGAYCPDNAYVLIGSPRNVTRYLDITGANAAEARARRDQYVAAGNVRRLACPRSHMVFDSGLLDPRQGTALDTTTPQDWCKARELLDVLAHEKFHEIVIEDEVRKLRERPDFRSQPASARATRERAVFRQGASHDNHRVVYNWHINVNRLALKLIEARLSEIARRTGAPAAAGEAEALRARKDCVKKRIADLLGHARRATGGTNFESVIVREPHECVGTTYRISETVVEEGSVPVELEEPAISEDTTTPGQANGIPDCHDDEGSSTTVVSAPPQTTPRPDTQVPEDGGQTPTTSMTPTTPTTPTTTVVEETPEPGEVPEEQLDLGLVKAAKSVVTVALSRTKSGDPIEGATVKLVEEAPDLPTDRLGENKEKNLAEYMTDQTAATTGMDGAAQVTMDPVIEAVPDDEDISRGTTVLDVGDADADDDGTIRVRHQIKAAEPMAQAVVAVTGEKGAAPAALALPATIESKWRERICVRRSFRIGEASIYVLRVPEEEMERFKTAVKQTESVQFVEDDSCREKERMNVTFDRNARE